MSNGTAPIVTTVITTYKREASIVKRALDSIVNQTYENIEIIVVNDCPQEAELAQKIGNMISKYNNENIHYIVVEKNGGACKARNLALSKASGEFIAYLDDDDEWLPEKIELQVAALQKDETAGIAYCNAMIYREGCSTAKVRFQQDPLKDNIRYKMFGANVIGSCSFPMFRVSELKRVNGFREDMPALQDWELYLRLLKNCGAVYVEKPVAKYYFYEGERLSAHPENRTIAYEKIHKEFENELESDKKSAAAFYMMGVYFYSILRDIRKANSYYLLALKYAPGNIKTNFKNFVKMLARFFFKPRQV